MLKTRIITAIALLALLLPGLFHLPQTGWAVMMAAFIGVAAWEWGGLMRLPAAGSHALGAAFAALALLITFLLPGAIAVDGLDRLPDWVFVAHLVSAAFWLFVAPWWLARRMALPGGLPGLLLGLVILLPTWLAVVQLRAVSPSSLLAVLAVVWVADIAAYFAGKTFGRHKLAPAISPGKTWEGAAGAVLGVLIYGFAVKGSLPLPVLPPLLWGVALLVITAISIQGDLFESLLKRQAGLKDSSQVLPGHGGVLDRIDSLTSTLPLVALLWLLAGRS